MKQRTLIGALALSTLGWSLNAQADAIIDCNTAALNVIRLDRTAPPVAARALAILHTAMYDAVNGIGRTHKAYFVADEGPAALPRRRLPSQVDSVLTTLFPASAAMFERLRAASLRAIPNSPQKPRGVAWANGLLIAAPRWRAADGSNTLVAPPAANGPGDWQPTAPANDPYLLPQWGLVAPFAMTHHRSSLFRPAGPVRGWTTPEWAADYNEVKSIGSANQPTAPGNRPRSPSSGPTARALKPPRATGTAYQQCRCRGKSTLAENARLFALLKSPWPMPPFVPGDAKYTFTSGVP